MTAQQQTVIIVAAAISGFVSLGSGFVCIIDSVNPVSKKLFWLALAACLILSYFAAGNVN